MSKSKFSRITRRDFLRGSATILAGASALKSLPAFAQRKVSPSTDYSSVIEKVEKELPTAIALKDITGASVAIIDGENIVLSKGFGYTDRSRKVKVTADTLFHVGSISKSFTALVNFIQGDHPHACLLACAAF